MAVRVVKDPTYAVVAAKTSTRLAFATVTNVSEKTAVNSIVTASRSIGLLTKYRAKIEVVGNKEERNVLTLFANAVIPFSS